MFATIVGPYPGAGEAAVSDSDALRAALKDQLDAGLGMLTDGHMWTLAEEAGPGDLDSIVDGWRLADDTIRALAAELEPGLAPPLVKACLVGPYSAVRRRSGGMPAERRHATLTTAERLNAVAAALFEAGAAVVQFSEDSLTRVGVSDDQERRLAAEALRRATLDLPGHVTLSVSGGNADAAGAALFFDLPVASYAFDLIHGPDNWRLITQAPGDRGIVCGVADARRPDPDVEAVLIWAARYTASSNGRGLERVGLAPSAGFDQLPRDAARAKLAVLAEAARKCGLPGAQLVQEMDPRAVDARSAALGKFDPAAAAKLRRRQGRGRAGSGDGPRPKGR